MAKALEGTPGASIELLEEGADMHVERSVIKAGGTIPEHSHKVASSYVVVKGSGELTGKSGRRVSTGDTVLIPAGQQHGWKGGEGDGLTIVGVFNGPQEQ
ncbi:MAG: cupin domain-containing protein [Acidobacteriaceae bacterium]|nr:cupin domain-containing protein [Acidobacteriaceae bacterium]